mgnify:CR=1 FL=1
MHAEKKKQRLTGKRTSIWQHRTGDLHGQQIEYKKHCDKDTSIDKNNNTADMKAEAAKCDGAGLVTDELGSCDDYLVTMSTLTEEGVIAVRNAACERLLSQCVEVKMKSKKLNDCLNRIHVAMPRPRDGKDRPPCIPQTVLEGRLKANRKEKKLEKDLENENGGAGVYSSNLRKRYILGNDEWKDDIIPEIMDGHNIADFIDKDILQRLEELEDEQGIREAEEGEEGSEMSDEDLTPEEKEALDAIRKKKKQMLEEHRAKKATASSKPVVPRKFDKDRKFDTTRMERHLSSMGMDPSTAVARARSKSLSIQGRKTEHTAEDKTDSSIRHTGNTDRSICDNRQKNHRDRSLQGQMHT